MSYSKYYGCWWVLFNIGIVALSGKFLSSTNWGVTWTANFLFFYTLYDIFLLQNLLSLSVLYIIVIRTNYQYPTYFKKNIMHIFDILFFFEIKWVMSSDFKHLYKRTSRPNSEQYFSLLLSYTVFSISKKKSMPGGNSDGFEWKGYMGQLWWNIEYIWPYFIFKYCEI
jgi:hypothetical protein